MNFELKYENFFYYFIKKNDLFQLFDVNKTFFFTLLMRIGPVNVNLTVY